MSEPERSNGPAPPPAKTRFYQLCTKYDAQLKTFSYIAETSGGSREVVDLMFVEKAVLRADAEKVLATVTKLTGKTWSLNNVEVPLID